MKSDTAPELVFVYGTLRRGGSNAFRMDGAEFVGRGEVAGRIVAISWYPGLVPGLSDRWVQGELYYVSHEHLRALDEYEGLAAGEMEGSEYRRTRMKAYSPGSQLAMGDAWVWQWIGPFDEKRVVKSGDWVDFAVPSPAAWCTWVAMGCLIAYFIHLASIPEHHSRLKPPTQTERLLAQAAHGAPFLALLFAWFGSRRREKWEVFRTVILLFSGGLTGLMLIGLIRLALEYFP